MKQLAMVGLVALICACGGGHDRGPPSGEPIESFGQWVKDGYTFYSVNDPKTGAFVVVQAAAVWRCNIDGTSCTNIPLSGCLSTGPSGSASPGAPPPPPPAPDSTVPVACPAVCNCMSTTDCNYYCGNKYIDSGSGHPFPSGINPVPGPK
jgi:hypothetical protein